MKTKIDKKELSIEKNDSKLAEVYSITENPPVLSLIPKNEVLLDSESREKTFDLVIRLPKTDQFIVTVSTKNEELCIWDIIK